MKRILFLLCIGITTLGFSYDRFHSDLERNDEILGQFNENLEKIHNQLTVLNAYQIQLLDALLRISLVADQHAVETWVNQPTFSQEND